MKQFYIVWCDTITWHQLVLQTPTIRLRWSSSVGAARKGERWESLSSPLPHDHHEMLLPSNTANLPILPEVSVVGCWFVLGFFCNMNIKNPFGTGFPAHKDKSYFFFSLPRYRIGPFEVENALLEHPAVAETAVVSSPDPLRGEVMMLSSSGGSSMFV